MIFLVKDKIGVQFGDRTIALELENAISQVMGQMWTKDLSQFDLFAKPYLVNIDRTGVRPKTVHPAPIIQTSDAPSGVRFIFSECEDDRRYEPILPQNLVTYLKLGMSELTQAVGYVVFSDRNEFYNLPDTVEKVREFIVRPFSAWDDKEEYPLPSGVAETIIQMTIDSIKGNKVEGNIFRKATPAQ